MKYEIAPQYTSLESFIKSIPENFKKEGKIIYKGRNNVKQFEVNGLPIIVKQYKVPILIQRIIYSFFRPSKAKRAFLYAQRLLQLGIDTPQGIAYIEIKKHGLFSIGYFVSTVNNNPNLTFLVQDPQPAIIDSFARFLAFTQEKGFIHGDLNLTNILYNFHDGQYQFSVIDTNRSIFVDRPTQGQCLKSMMKITHNRDLMKLIIASYAKVKGWDEKYCQETIFSELDRFEQRKNKKAKVQNMLKSK